MTDPRDYRIIDLHHHVGSLEGVLGTGQSEEAGGDAEAAMDADAARRLAYMDRHGIAQAVLLPGNGYAMAHGLADTRAVNDDVARYRARHPDRFPAAFGTVSPLEGPGALDEIDRCIQELGMSGIVWHHRFQGSVINHVMMDPLLERLRRHGKPAFIHVIADSTLESPWRLELLADRYPDMTFVALDGFSSCDHAHWMTYIAQKHPNILFDTGVMISVAHLIDHFIATVGAERLLFGTDYYSAPRLFNHPFPLYELLASDVPDGDRRKVLGDNARRLLGLR